MEHYFEILKGHYGNHSRVARALGITPRHYRVIRNGAGGGTPIRLLIKHMAKEVEATGRRAA